MRYLKSSLVALMPWLLWACSGSGVDNGPANTGTNDSGTPASPGVALLSECNPAKDGLRCLDDQTGIVQCKLIEGAYRFGFDLACTAPELCREQDQKVFCANPSLPCAAYCLEVDTLHCWPGDVLNTCIEDCEQTAADAGDCRSAYLAAILCKSNATLQCSADHYVYEVGGDCSNETAAYTTCKTSQGGP